MASGSAGGNVQLAETVDGADRRPSMLSQLFLEGRYLGLQLLETLAQLLDAVPLRVGQAHRGLVAGVIEGNDLAGHADNSRVGRHVGEHDRAGADPDVVADLDVADDFRPGADDDVVAQSRMALLTPVAGAAEGNALGEVAVVTDDRGLTHDDAHAVVDEQTLAEYGRGMNLHARHEAVEHGDHAR